MTRYLILENDLSIAGEGFGAPVNATGELAFFTGNYGYQEAITDPTNFGKILVFTSPMIGSAGINAVDYEAINPTIKAIVVNDIALNVTQSEEFQGLANFLTQKGIPGIYNADTRFLVHELRNHGSLKASVMDTDDEHAFDQIKALVLPKNKSQQASTSHAYASPNIGKSVVVLDLGLKHTLLRELSLKRINVTVLPFTSTIQEVENLRPDALIISNGPGEIAEVQATLRPFFERFYTKIPIFAVGLGFLAFSEFIGCDLIKLPISYNGANFPVISQNKQQIWQSAMNISSLVDPETSINFDEIYFDLNTKLVAGYKQIKQKVIAVAFNPEGAPGFKDATGIFDEFVKLMGE